LKRTIESDLSLWKDSKKRKPLIVKGARQVGKTFALKEFGKTHFDDTAYFNFERQADLAASFKPNLDPIRLLQVLSAVHGRKIVPGRTLLIFDEIQACDDALTSLKYFSEETPEFHIAAAGSLLGIKLGQSRSFPVGKVNFLQMHPMTFYEFLKASDTASMLDLLLDHRFTEEIPQVLHERLLHLLRVFLMVGGMPEAVKTWFDTSDFDSVRQIHSEIITSYQNDFEKHALKADALKIQAVWSSIPLQISRENKKFKYGDVKRGARSADFEVALHWLETAGLVLKVNHVDSGRRPLSAHIDQAKFKLFALDVGLLAAQLRISPKGYLSNDKMFSEFNGAFTENFVAQELIANGLLPRYWSSEHEAEVDFLVETSNEVIPIEVKAAASTRTKSLRIFEKKFSPATLVRTSALNSRKDGGIQNIPLYSIAHFLRQIERSS
jgi:predicted AAA+ superfamily ATPase